MGNYGENTINSTILQYEELAINAHPALQTQLYDGWILRFANGYTNRSNSISPLYTSTLGLQEKITECEKRYFEQRLPAVYKLTDGGDTAFDSLLESMGYIKVTPTYVMDMDLRDKDFTFGDCVLTSRADEKWLNAYFSFNHYADSINKQTAKQILDSVKNTMVCGRIAKDGVTTACGSAVIECGYIGLLNVVVDEPQRGNGYGKEICVSLLSAAKRLNAHTAYLQVVQDNKTAVNLYTKLGYKTVYSYWYRIKKEEQ